MSGAFIKAAVIGHPVRHSKSPLIHNYWIEKYALQGSYEAIDLAPVDLAFGIKRLIEEGYSGFNLTVPHKEAAMGLCNEIEEAALRIGAVNTLVVEETGRIRGLNTDSYGFTANIAQKKPGFFMSGKTALVLGAGGAARAVIDGLRAHEVSRILLTNRTREKALALAAGAQDIEVILWEEKDKALAAVEILINTTSLGMSGQPPLTIDLKHLPAEALVSDIVYAPLMTPLLQEAQMRGNPAVTGIGMLLHQARPAFEAWFGVLPDVDETLERMVLR
ncbi:MAG: shikimate dehydrogenase [Alphaproteobacteria bacterium]|nr:shikimate dehydrogenase [Alphaproteobacteria bacterium]